MSIDLGNNPVGTPPTDSEKTQMRTALGLTASDIKSSINMTDINVKDYGAVGDGVNNDYASIKNAISAAGASGTVFFPVGDYYCADSAGGGIDTPNFSGAKLHLETGATLSVHNIAFNASTTWQIVKAFNCEIRSRGVTTLQTENVLSTGLTSLLAGNVNSDKFYYEPTAEDFTTWTNATWASIGAGTPTNTASAATVSADTVNISVGGLSATQAQVGYRPLTSVGEYLEMTVSNDTSASVGAVGLLVRCGTSERYYLSTSKTSGQWIWTKYDGVFDPNNLVSGVLDNVTFSHGADSLPRIGVWVNKANEFWFCINGQRVGRFACTNSVTDLGYITTVHYDNSETNYYNPFSAIRSDIPWNRNLKIGFVGDSITYGAGVTLAYPEMIKRILESNESIASVDVSQNIATAGDTIIKQLEMIQDDSIDFSDCDFVCTLLGTNNGNSTLSGLATDLGDLVDEIKGQGTTPILGTPPPTIPPTEVTYHTYVNGASTKWKEMARSGPAISRTAAIKSVPVVDTNAVFGSQTNSQELLYDGVHPNDLGQAAIAKAFASGILKALESQTYMS